MSSFLSRSHDNSKYYCKAMPAYSSPLGRWSLQLLVLGQNKISKLIQDLARGPLLVHNAISHTHTVQTDTLLCSDVENMLDNYWLVSFTQSNPYLTGATNQLVHG